MASASPGGSRREAESSTHQARLAPPGLQPGWRRQVGHAQADLPIFQKVVTWHWNVPVTVFRHAEGCQ